MQTAAAAPPGDLVAVARVVDAYGIRGWLKLEPYSHEAAALHAATIWWLRKPGGAAERFECKASKAHSGSVVAQLEHIADRNAAEALKGAEVWVSRSAFPPAAADEFYWVDLVGCEVERIDGARLGPVAAVSENGAHAILEVRVAEAGDANKAVYELIPFVDAYVKQVDLAARRIVVDWAV